MNFYKRIVSVLMAAFVLAGSAANCLSLSAEASEQPVSATTVPVVRATGTNAVGKVVSDGINEEAAKMQNVEGCNIFSISTEGRKATVYFSTTEPGKLVLGVYTDVYEDGYEKMVASSVAEIAPGQKSVDLSFNVNLPKYYVLRAYLIGNDGNLLSKEFTDETYTKDIQLLMASDIHDYDGYNVLNLDEQDSTNFVVYQPDVKVLQSSSSENVVVDRDEVNKIYTFQNLSQDLHAGDTVSVENGSDDVTVFRVNSVENSGDQTIVHADPSMDTEDAFAYMKVDVDSSNIPEETDEPSINDVSKTIRLNLDGSVGNDYIQFTGTLRLQTTWTMNYVLCKTEHRSKSSFACSTDTVAEAAMSATGTFSIPLYAFDSPSILGTELDIGLFLKLELHGYVGGTLRSSSNYDEKGGNSSSDVSNLDVNGYFFVGIEVKAKATVLGCGLSASVSAGIIVNVVLDEPHADCDPCFSIELSAQLDYSVSFGFTSHLGVNWYGCVNFPFGTAYCSRKRGFGFGTCPDKLQSQSSSSSSGSGSGSSSTEPRDGLTDEQRENLQFVWDYRNGGYAVSVKDDKITSIESIEIPSTYYGKPVFEIGTGAIDGAGTEDDSTSYYVNWVSRKCAGFEGCTNLRSIILPDTVKKISKYAFAGCTSLEEIQFDSVTEIGDEAFICCKNLRINSLPSNLRSIGTFAFSACEKAFPHLVVPSSLTEIGWSPFYHCNAIQTLQCGVRNIGRGMFSKCNSLKTVTLAETTMSIGNNAFYYCPSLETVNLPETLREIGNSAFYYDEKLVNIKLPSCLVKLGSDALSFTAISDLKIPVMLSKLEAKTFYAMKKINEFVVPQRVSQIDFSAFEATYWTNRIVILNPKATITMPNNPTMSWYSPNSKIIYGYKGSTAEAFCEQYGFRFKALDGGSGGNVVTPAPTPDPVIDPVKTVTFSGLSPNTLYNFYDITDNTFATGHILFLSQQMSDKNGSLTVNYRKTNNNIASDQFVQCCTADNGFAAIGQNAAFRFRVYAGNASYHWMYLNGENWIDCTADDASSAVMNVPVTAEKDGQKYRCTIITPTDKTVESDIYTLNVLPYIIKQPVDVPAQIDDTAAFTVTASGIDLIYQWQFLDNGVWKNSGMTGAKTSTLSVPVTAARDGQQYRCIVSDSKGLTIISETAKIKVKPSITSQPQTQELEIGQTAKFTIVATGKNLKYQWQFLSSSGWKDSGMTGAKTAALSVPVTAERDGQQYRCVVTASTGAFVTSDPAKISVKTTITSQPTTQEIEIGQIAKFTVAATGVNLTYQWQFLDNGAWKNSGMTGAKTATLSVPVTAARDGQQYRCRVTASGTTLTSNTASIKVKTAITTQPTNQTGKIDSTVKFTVAASGTNLKYQWQFLSSAGWKNSGMTGANTATLSVPVTAARDGQQYKCVVTSANGSSAITNAVKLIAGVKITAQPKDYTGNINATAKFTVAAAGNNLSYQWQFNDNGVWKDSGMTGAKTATLSVPITAARNGQKYRCVVKSTNGTSEVSSVATLKAIVNHITGQPQNATGKVGDTVKFTVTASNATYQWQFLAASGWQNSGMNGATTATISVPVTEARDGQKYRCIVKFADGTTKTSNEVSLKVQAAITAQPQNTSGKVGATAKFTVAASGTNLTYQWQFLSTSGWQNSGMTGAKTATISVPITDVRNGQQYRCIVTSGNGTNATSNTAKLTVTK